MWVPLTLGYRDLFLFHILHIKMILIVVWLSFYKARMKCNTKPSLYQCCLLLQYPSSSHLAMNFEVNMYYIFNVNNMMQYIFFFNVNDEYNLKWLTIMFHRISFNAFYLFIWKFFCMYFWYFLYKIMFLTIPIIEIF